MDNLYAVDSPAVALTAGTAKSVLVVTGGANKPLSIVQMTVGCDATSTGLLKVELLAGTLSGGTTTTAPNIARMNIDALSAAPIFAASSYSAEPTYTKLANNGALAIKTMVFPLPMGSYDIEFPLGRGFAIPVSSSFAVRLTSTTVSPNAYTNLIIGE
jgi:hypothetical protein